MGRIIGIDLGTTYSAVAIPEERTGEGFFVAPGCPGYAILLDGFKRGTTPSVVAEDSAGKIVVGHMAKARAGLAPEPIMFAKRWMGEDKTFQLNKQGTLRPEDVSAHVLRYLKEMAEKRLGEKVDEAVITVPAYFILRARQKTEEAALKAGLKVAQIAQEPVAAALMYCAGDPRDPLRILTYDLGGGTFDVAILEKKDGIISTDSVRAFDGDRFLGGYNFDKKLALWIAEQLRQRGYDLTLDLDKPADKVIFAKLMVLAEEAKIALSHKEHVQLMHPASGIIDHAGNPVAIELEITRGHFESLIAKDIDYTLDICRRALSEKAQPAIKIEQIDEIVMVGGSSKIPLVSRRLEETFGKKPRLIEPDLCVALGAAILAGTKPQTVGCLKLDPLPAETDLPHFTLTGQVLKEGGVASVQGCAVSLRALDGSFKKALNSDGHGMFAFDRVPLAIEATTDFVLSVGSGGKEVAQKKFTIKHSGAVEGPPPVVVSSILSKPIGILLMEGVEIVAPERSTLPCKVVIQACTLNASGQFSVPIMEEHNRLGEIVMKDLPTTLPVGSPVEVTLTIEANYQIHGRAYVPALAKEATATIHLPTPPPPQREALRKRFEKLLARAEDALSTASKEVLFGGGKGKRLKDRIQMCKDLFAAGESDLFMIQDKLDEIESLIREIGTVWKPEPPVAVFEQYVEDTKEHLAQAIKKDARIAQEGFDKQLDAIDAEAKKALAAQNASGWKDANNRVVSLCDRLAALAKPKKSTQGEGTPENPAQVQMSLAKELAGLKEFAEANGTYQPNKELFAEVANDLKKIDPKAGDAMNQIRDWYFTKYEDLKKRVKDNRPSTTEVLLGRQR